MAKKKRGRLRGRGMQGTGPRNGNGYRGGHNRPMRPPSYDADPQRQSDLPQENGEIGPLEPGGGVLEMHPNGYGFLRNPNNHYVRELTDPFVPGSMIEKFGLREGLIINGMVQPGRRQQG